MSYTPRHAIPKQRRYADGPCLFRLPRKARYAAAHGLYVDGDLVGSELIALQHACHELNIDCDNLDEHLEHREAQLAALGKSHCPSSASSAQRRDFAKAYVNAVVHGAGVRPSGVGQPRKRRGSGASRIAGHRCSARCEEQQRHWRGRRTG